jgi:hypothetical protein
VVRVPVLPKVIFAPRTPMEVEMLRLPKDSWEDFDRTATTRSGERPKEWPRVPRGVRHEMPNNAEAHIWLGCVCSRSDINRQ